MAFYHLDFTKGSMRYTDIYTLIWKINILAWGRCHFFLWNDALLYKSLTWRERFKVFVLCHGLGDWNVLNSYVHLGNLCCVTRVPLEISGDATCLPTSKSITVYLAFAWNIFNYRGERARYSVYLLLLLFSLSSPLFRSRESGTDQENDEIFCDSRYVGSNLMVNVSHRILPCPPPACDVPAKKIDWFPLET